MFGRPTTGPPRRGDTRPGRRDHAKQRLDPAGAQLSRAHAGTGSRTALVWAGQALAGDRLAQSTRNRAMQLRHSLLRSYPTLSEVRSFGDEVRGLMA
ncbi:hypothetical protein [Streptomyces radicis]|uniref:hypothetical protein n=1 Tax=Streptomyces radicis TaxID=1750517 RepID=UPI0011C49A9F|nr:hypothetical protein [Streptomyces radicis]